MIYGILGGFALSIGFSLMWQADDSGSRVWGALVLGMGIGLLVRAWMSAGRR